MMILKHKKYILVILAISVVLLLGGVYLMQYKNKTENSLICEKPECVAVVEQKFIKKNDFDREVGYLRKFYSWSKQDLKDETIIKKDILERLIENEVASQFAFKNNISANDDEVQQRYEAAYRNEGGEQQYLSKLNEMYGMGKEDKIKAIKLDILKEKIEQSVGKNWVDWINEQKVNTKIERNL